MTNNSTSALTTQPHGDYKPLPHEREEWTGYTLEELRYQRAITTARLEIQKERLTAQLQAIKSGQGNMSAGLYGRLFSSLNYVDYGILAFRIIRRVTSMLRGLRRK